MDNFLAPNTFCLLTGKMEQLEEFGLESSRDKLSFMDRIRKQSFFLTQISNKPFVQVFVIIFTNLWFLCCFAYHNTYSVIIIYTVARNDAQFWDILARFLTCASIAISMNTAIFKFNVIYKINTKFYAYFETLRKNQIQLINFPKATNFIIYGTLYVAFCLLIVILIIFRTTFVEDRDVFVKMICSVGFCNFTSLEESRKTKIYNYDLFYYSLGTVSATVFINMVYCYFCLGIMSLSETASRHTQYLVEKSHDVIGISRDVVLNHRLFCKDVKILITHMNDIFAPVLVFFYGASLLSTCHFITRIIASSNRITVLQICLYFICYGQSFIGVFIISWVSSKIPEMFNKIYVEMQCLTLNRENVPLDVYAELNILLSQIQTQPVGISIGGSFLITRNFYISYLGSIITFVVVLVQFSSNKV